MTARSRSVISRLHETAIFLLAWAALYSLNLASVRSTKIFNADLITPFLIAEDFLRDLRSIRFWNFPDAPYFFPDTLLAIILMGITNDFKVSVLLAVGINTAIFCMLLFLFTRLASQRSQWASVAATIVACHIALALLDPVAYEMLLTPQFRPYIHSGAFLLSGFSFYLLLVAYRKPSTFTIAALLFVCIASTISDALYLVQFAIPAIMICFYNLLKKAQRRTSLSLAIAIVGAVVVAKIVSSALGIRPVTSEIDTAAILSSTVDGLSWIGGHILLTLGATAGLVFAAVALVTRDQIQEPGYRVRSVMLFASTLALLVNIAAVFLTAKFQNEQSFRYLLTWQWSLFAIVLILCAEASRVGQANFIRLPSLKAIPYLVFITALFATLPNAQRLLHHTDPFVACYKQMLSENGVRLAVGDYWNTKSFAAFSNSTEQSIIPITREGAVYTWAYSPERINASLAMNRTTGVQAVTLNGMDKSSIENSLGSIDSVFSCEGFRFGSFNDSHIAFQNVDAHFRELPSR